MHRELAFLFIVLICTTALSACEGSEASTVAATVSTAQPSEPAATASPTTTTIPAILITEPAITLMPGGPTIAVTPSLPGLTGNDLYFGDFFFEGSNSPNCSLPCWHDLVIGQSSETVVLGEFATIVGATSFEQAGLDLLMNGESGMMPNIYSKGFTYATDIKISKTADSEYRDYGNFSGFAVFSTDTKRLELLGFNWWITEDSQLEVHLSPQRVIKEMGPPSSMLVGGGDFWVDLLLVYDEGVVFQYTNDKTSISETVDQYCFGDTEVNIKGAFITGSMYMLEPFDDGLNRLSPLQDTTVGAAIRWFYLQPPEEFFGLSQDAIVERILREADTCLLLDIDN